MKSYLQFNISQEAIKEQGHLLLFFTLYVRAWRVKFLLVYWYKYIWIVYFLTSNCPFSWSINVTEYRRSNPKWTSYTYRQHWVHKTTTNKQKHNTPCVGHHCLQTNTINFNKTWALLQTTVGKDEPNKHK